MRTATSALGIAIGVGLAGCLPSCSSPGSGDSAASSGAPIAESDLRQRLIDAVCSGLADCCQSHGYAYDRQACMDAVDLEFSDMVSSADRYAYNATAAGACIQGVRNTVAACGDMDDVAECEAVFTGTLPEGATCDGDSVCAAPTGGVAVCTYSSDGDLGTCRPLARAAQGEACAASGQDGDWYEVMDTASGGICFREDGLFCENFDTCQPLRAVGDACSYYDDCVDGAVCDSSSDTCVAISAVGGPCDYDGHCVEDTYCATDLTCQPLQGAGAACETDLQCRSYFCDGGVCAGEDEWPSAELCAGDYD